VVPLLDRIAGRFADLIATGPTPQELAAIRAAQTIGRPLGAARFLDRLEAKLGRPAGGRGR
jgi:putative transposase